MSSGTYSIYSDLYPLNLISLVSASLVLILYFVARFLKPNLTTRVTLKLQTGSAATDFVLHVIYLLDKSTTSCDAIGFFRYSTRLMYCLINICIAVNLQLIFVSEKEPVQSWEFFYWAASILLPIIINIGPAFSGYFTKSGPTCTLNTDTDPQKFIAILHSVIMFGTFLVCLFVSISVTLRLRKDWTSLVTSTFSQMTQSRKRLRWLQKELKGIALKVVLYPTVSFLVLSGIAISQFSFLLPESEDTLQAWSIVCQSLAGLSDFLAILFDPSLQYCYKQIWRDFINLFDKKKVILDEVTNGVTNEVESTPNPPTSIEIRRFSNQYISDHDMTIYSDESSEGSYRCVIFDDAECRRAVNLF